MVSARDSATCHCLGMLSLRHPPWGHLYCLPGARRETKGLGSHPRHSLARPRERCRGPTWIQILASALLGVEPQRLRPAS